MDLGDTLIISDSIVEGLSLSYLIASNRYDKVVWISSEHFKLIDSIISAYKKNINVKIFSSRKWRDDINAVNLLNLNEVSIAISRQIDDGFVGAYIFSILPELLLIHGLEKTYMFLLNMIWKIKSIGGMVIACLNSGTQSRKEEAMIERLFSNIIYLKRETNIEKFKRKLILVSPIYDKDIYQFEMNGFRIVFPKELERILIEKS